MKFLEMHLIGDFGRYVDKNGETRVMIECMVDEDEKERVWDLLRFKHKRDCSISSEPSELLSDKAQSLLLILTTIFELTGDFKN